MKKPDSLRDRKSLDTLLHKLDNGHGFTTSTAHVNEQLTRKTMKEAADIIRFLVKEYDL